MQPPTINTGDTAWMLVSTALVLFMTPGLALFYGGLVRNKNVLSTFMHSFLVLGLITLQWTLFGYSLAFGDDHGGLIGGFNFAFLNGVGLEPKAGQTIPHVLFMAFQMMFAIITPALISGAFAERMKFTGYALFTLLWATFIYDPLCHWVWAEGGWLFKMGALDFAGGTVVHISAGVSALVFATMIGKRLGYPKEKIVPHNMPMVLLGAGILWFGWFGFNAGSALTAGGLAALALVNTQIAAGVGALAWIVIDMTRHGKASALGFASGLVAGLVAITPAAGFVSPMAAIVIGLCAGGVCYAGVLLKARFQYDDALDAFGIHGIGGALGALLTGVFTAKVWNPAGTDGLLAGDSAIMVKQLIAVSASVAFAAGGTFVLAKLVDVTVGLRATKEEEQEGLDINLHGEEGYQLGLGAGGYAVPEMEEEPTSVLVPSPALK